MKHIVMDKIPKIENDTLDPCTVSEVDRHFRTQRWLGNQDPAILQGGHVLASFVTTSPLSPKEYLWVWVEKIADATVFGRLASYPSHLDLRLGDTASFPLGRVEDIRLAGTPNLKH